MFQLVIILFCLAVSLSAYEANIDINRVQKVDPIEYNSRENYYSRRSIAQDHSAQYKDGYNKLKRDFTKMPTHIGMIPPKSSIKENSSKIYQPREDPRLFYQSDSYLQEQNVNYEVASIYPGRDVVRANQHSKHNSIAELRLTDGEKELSNDSDCVLCPRDRTLVAKPGSNRVIFLKPRLFGCSKNKYFRDIHFEHIYGPAFGSLLEKGTHVIVGRIHHQDRPLQLCKMQIHVITQSCPVPKYLTTHCDDRGNREKICRFSCRQKNMELHGSTSLYCESNRWSGKLPVCKIRTSCEAPLPPDHGWISCKGSSVTAGAVLREGSKCRVNCGKGWRRSGHTTICRRGSWTKHLSCF